YASLTMNVRLSGGPIDFWALDPVALFFGSVGINAQAPHPKAALLGANFLLSREAQQFLTKRGRMPTRTDVAVNPPEGTDRLKDRKIIATIFSGEEQKKWQWLLRELFTPKEDPSKPVRLVPTGVDTMDAWGRRMEVLRSARHRLGGFGARCQRGTNSDQGGGAIRDEGRCGDRGLAGLALPARGDGDEGARQASLAGQVFGSSGAALEARGGAHQLQSTYRRDGGT